MINRRKFIQNTSLAVAGSMFLPKILLAAEKEKSIGIQLYTIRDAVKADFLGTLTRISEIGYNAVEAAGYADGNFYGYSPKEYKKICEDLNLQPQSSHTAVNLDNADVVIEKTIEAGMSYLVLPWIGRERRMSVDSYKQLAEELNQIGEKCKKNGIMFAYHNHAFEFEKIGEVIPYDLLLEQTEPDFVSMQLDLYWMVYGGYQPLEYFKTYPGRFALWHIKDMDKTEKRESTEIGSGIIDFEELFANRDLAGLRNIYVEQESFKIDPFKSIQQSFEYLNQMEF
jgi:sugar phosphate isomerase/epimerase